jgi:SAM-dependent methyltransferase
MFGRSAAVYDLLYAGKDYAGEAAALGRLLRRRRPRARTLLELGCGTGRHALELARLGLRVTGLDASAAMLARARRRAAASGLPRAAMPVFRAGDLRSARLGRRYDAVAAFFHVFSYLRGRSELAAALAAARTHLRSGGILHFDVWHARDARERSSFRRAEAAGLRVTRRAAVRYDAARRSAVVTQSYNVRRGGTVARFRETHLMRYWSRREVEDALSAAGFSPLAARDGATGGPLARGSRSATFTAVAR